MKSFINNLNQDALAKLASTLSHTKFTVAIIWTGSQYFYTEDESTVEFVTFDDTYHLRLCSGFVRMTFDLTKAEFIALSALCAAKTENIRNYAKGE